MRSVHTSVCVYQRRST